MTLTKIRKCWKQNLKSAQNRHIKRPRSWFRAQIYQHNEIYRFSCILRAFYRHNHCFQKLQMKLKTGSNSTHKSSQRLIPGPKLSAQRDLSIKRNGEGSFENFGITVASCWDHFGIILGSCWDHFGIILGSFWDHVGIIFGSFWDHFGIKLGSI